MGPDNQKQDRTKKTEGNLAIPSYTGTKLAMWLCHISNAKTVGCERSQRWLVCTAVVASNFPPFAKHIAKSHEAPLSEFGKVQITKLYSNNIQISMASHTISYCYQKNIVFRRFLPVAPMRSSRSQSGAVAPE